MNSIGIMYFRSLQKTDKDGKGIVGCWYPSPYGEQHRITYNELVHLLTKSRRSNEKGSMGSVIFGDFFPGQTDRKSQNIMSRNCITLEIDGLLIEDKQRLREGLEVLGYECIGYSSFSHLKDGKTCKLHLVFPLAEEISSKEHYKAAYMQLQSQFLQKTGFVLNEEKISKIKRGEINLDQSACSWALVMYLPCAPYGRVFNYLYYKGRFFNPCNDRVWDFADTIVKKENTQTANQSTETANNNTETVNKNPEVKKENHKERNPIDRELDKNRKYTVHKYAAGYKVINHYYDYKQTEEQFCSSYTWQQVFAYFLSDVYVQCSEKRYRYINAKSEGGMVILDEDLCYSHHSQDAACTGKACNKFWLVCIHKFNGRAKDCVKWIKENNLVVC